MPLPCHTFTPKVYGGGGESRHWRGGSERKRPADLGLGRIRGERGGEARPPKPQRILEA